jgi:hypothetical protein
MEAKYQTLLEQIAEWFMHLFFDPTYHSLLTSQNDNSTKQVEMEEQVEKARKYKIFKVLFYPFQRLTSVLIKAINSVNSLFMGFELTGVIPLLTFSKYVRILPV